MRAASPFAADADGALLQVFHALVDTKNLTKVNNYFLSVVSREAA